MPESRQDFWRHKDQWPVDRTKTYLFILDALNQLGTCKFPGSWSKETNYFYRHPDIQIPLNPNDADDAQKDAVHQVLSRSKENYTPAEEEDGFYEAADEWHGFNVWHRRFSHDDWSYVTSAPHRAPWDDFAFEWTVESLLNGLARGELASFGKAFGMGEFEPIDATRWNLELARIIEVFAFGEIEIFSGPSSAWPETNRRGNSHWIFIQKSSFDSWLAAQGFTGVRTDAPNYTSAATINRVKDWLVGLRKAGPQRARRDAFQKLTQKQFGIAENAFDRAWELAALEYPTENWSLEGRPSKAKLADEKEFLKEIDLLFHLNDPFPR